MNSKYIFLIFIHAHRTGDFQAYVRTLECLTLDRTNYARWIRDMNNLPESVKEDFAKFWVVPKTSNTFSYMPINERHDTIVKGLGGAVGLTENFVVKFREANGDVIEARKFEK